MFDNNDSQIAQALSQPLAQKPEQDEILYVTFGFPHLFSFRIMQFGKPSLMLKDFIRQLGEAATLMQIFIENKDGKLVALHEPEKEVHFLQSTVVEHSYKPLFRKSKTKLTEVLNFDMAEWLAKPRTTVIATHPVNYVVMSPSDKAANLAMKHIIRNALEEYPNDND